MSSRFPCNSEANASELQGNLEDMFLRFYKHITDLIHTSICKIKTPNESEEIKLNFRTLIRHELSISLQKYILYLFLNYYIIIYCMHEYSSLEQLFFIHVNY